MGPVSFFHRTTSNSQDQCAQEKPSLILLSYRLQRFSQEESILLMIIIFVIYDSRGKHRMQVRTVWILHFLA